MAEQRVNERGYSIDVSMTLLGTFTGEDFPLESALRRKLRDVGKDNGRFKVTNFKTDQDELTEIWKRKEDD